MALLTTTIGTYPKPDYVPVADWWRVRDVGRGQPTRFYDEYLRDRPDDAKGLLDRGTREAVRDQVAVGIDIPTDGEIRREHYDYYHCHHLRGMNFERLTRKSMRNGSWQAEVPSECGPILGRTAVPA